MKPYHTNEISRRRPVLTEGESAGKEVSPVLDLVGENDIRLMDVTSVVRINKRSHNESNTLRFQCIRRNILTANTIWGARPILAFKLYFIYVFWFGWVKRPWQHYVLISGIQTFEKRPLSDLHEVGPS